MPRPEPKHQSGLRVRAGPVPPSCGSECSAATPADILRTGTSAIRILIRWPRDGRRTTRARVSEPTGWGFGHGSRCLSEGYSNADFKTRIVATYNFVQEVLSLAAEQRRPSGHLVMASNRAADRLGGRAVGPRPSPTCSM